MPVGGPDLWVPVCHVPRSAHRGFGAEQYNSRRGLTYQAFGGSRTECHAGAGARQRRRDRQSAGRALFPNDNRGRTLHAAADHRRRVAARVSSSNSCCRARRDGRGRPRAADRVRQRRQPVAGAGQRAAAGNRRAAVDRREPRAADAATADRKPAAVAGSAALAGCSSPTGLAPCSGPSARRSCRPTSSI